MFRNNHDINFSELWRHFQKSRKKIDSSRVKKNFSKSRSHFLTKAAFPPLTRGGMLLFSLCSGGGMLPGSIPPPEQGLKSSIRPPSSRGGTLLWSKSEIAILRNFFQLARNQFSFKIFENVARVPKS